MNHKETWVFLPVGGQVRLDPSLDHLIKEAVETQRLDSALPQPDVFEECG